MFIRLNGHVYNGSIEKVQVIFGDAFRAYISDLSTGVNIGVFPEDWLIRERREWLYVFDYVDNHEKPVIAFSRDFIKLKIGDKVHDGLDVPFSIALTERDIEALKHIDDEE